MHPPICIITAEMVNKHNNLDNLEINLVDSDGMNRPIYSSDTNLKIQLINTVEPN